MSRLLTDLFPRRLRLRLSPYELRWRGERLPCDTATGAEPWQGAVAKLETLQLGHCRITVELSNRLVRYALVPWSDALATPAEEERYARHHFAKIYGERASAWAVRSAEAAPGEPRLACAVDAALIAALKKAFAKKKAKLASIQPALMSRFNAVRKAVPPAGAWLVLAEPERACIALYARRGWRSVQNAKGEWRAALERERYRADGPVPSLVLLAGAAPPASDAAFRFQAIAA